MKKYTKKLNEACKEMEDADQKYDNIGSSPTVKLKNLNLRNDILYNPT